MTTTTRLPATPGTKARRGPQTKVGSVLVVTSFDAASDVALRRGEALARAMEARLVVLHVVASRSWVARILPFFARANDPIAPPESLIADLEKTRLRCQAVLGADAELPLILVRRGRAARAVLEAARDFEASLIVVGDSPNPTASRFGRAGVTATLVRKARCPVLIARAARSNNEIVVGTDLAHAEYPALCEAARLGVRLGAHVTFVHNVQRSDRVSTAHLFGFPVPATTVPGEPDRARHQDELARIARAIGQDIETVVSIDARPTDAILDVARTRDADLVVVGARRRRGEIDAGKGTVLNVAQEAYRSVLTVPMYDA